MAREPQHEVVGREGDHLFGRFVVLEVVVIVLHEEHGRRAEVRAVEIADLGRDDRLEPAFVVGAENRHVARERSHEPLRFGGVAEHDGTDRREQIPVDVVADGDHGIGFVREPRQQHFASILDRDPVGTVRVGIHRGGMTAGAGVNEEPEPRRRGGGVGKRRNRPRVAERPTAGILEREFMGARGLELRQVERVELARRIETHTGGCSKTRTQGWRRRQRAVEACFEQQAIVAHRGQQMPHGAGLPFRLLRISTDRNGCRSIKRALDQPAAGNARGHLCLLTAGRNAVKAVCAETPASLARLLLSAAPPRTLGTARPAVHCPGASSALYRRGQSWHRMST